MAPTWGPWTRVCREGAAASSASQPGTLDGIAVPFHREEN